jgi:hypothetical protein
MQRIEAPAPEAAPDAAADVSGAPEIGVRK